MKNWIARAWRRLRHRKVVANADIHVPMTNGRTLEEAITIAVALIRAGLDHVGTDMAEGSVRHHIDEFDGEDYLHAVWIHDAMAAELEAEAAS